MYAGLSLASFASYILASVPSPAPLDRSLGTLSPEHAVELRLNKVNHVTLENVDPSATEEEIHDLLLQAIQDAQLAEYCPLSPLSTPELAIPPLAQADIFLNWKADLYISNTPVHFLLEQLPRVVVKEGLGQREVKDTEDLVFRAREHYQTPIPISRRRQNHWVYWPKVDHQQQDIAYDNEFTPCLHT